MVGLSHFFLKIRKLAALGICLALAAPVLAPGVASERAAKNAPGEEWDRIRDLLPSGAIVATAGEDGSLDVAAPPLHPYDVLGGAFEEPEHLLDPTRYAGTVRTLLEASWGVDLPDMRELARSQPTGAGGDVQPLSESTDTVRIGLPAGDATGDGLDDALSLEFDLVTLEPALRVLSGADGTEIWFLDAAGAYDLFPLPVGDLTGDGADDILLLRFFLDASGGQCAVVACAFEFQYRWRFDLLSGPTGDSAWTREYEGVAAEAFAIAPGIFVFAFEEAFTATNVAVLPFLGDDHDGDGRPDVVFNAFDLVLLFGAQFALAAGVQIVELTATQAALVGGDDGVPFLERHAPLHPGVATLEPAGDAVGSDTRDLLWQDLTFTPIACVLALLVFECVVQGVLDLELLDGAAPHEAAWMSRTVLRPGVLALVLPVENDLTGDGAEDLVIFELAVSARYGNAWGVLSGVDGSEAWTQSLGFFEFPILPPLGPVGGGPGDDLLLVGIGFGASSFDLVLTRINGADGSTLFQTTQSIPLSEFSFVLVGFFLLGDSDGDGVQDSVTDAIAFGGDSTIIVESGATGDVLLVRSATGLAFGLPAGDVDPKKNEAQGVSKGKPRSDDLYHVRVGASSVSWTLVSLPKGKDLWTRTDAFAGPFGFLLVSTEDQVGNGGADAIYSRLQFPGNAVESRIDGVDGRTGELRWGHGSILSPAPPPAAPPVHDAFADALVIPGVPYADRRDTTTATTEPGEPAPCAGIGATVWYAFTPASDGTIQANTSGSNYDTVLAAYTGTGLADLNTVACNDDAVGLQSRISFAASAGTTYAFQAGGYFGSSGTLVFNLDFVPAPPPPPPPTAPPSEPQNVTATGLHLPGQITVRWEPPRTGLGSVDTYRVHRAAASGGPYAEIAAVDGLTFWYRDAGLDVTQVYSYVITAENVVGPSGISNEACARPVPWVVEVC